MSSSGSNSRNQRHHHHSSSGTRSGSSSGARDQNPSPSVGRSSQSTSRSTFRPVFATPGSDSNQSPKVFQDRPRRYIAPPSPPESPRRPEDGPAWIAAANHRYHPATMKKRSTRSPPPRPRYVIRNPPEFNEFVARQRAQGLRDDESPPRDRKLRPVGDEKEIKKANERYKAQRHFKFDEELAEERMDAMNAAGRKRGSVKRSDSFDALQSDDEGVFMGRTARAARAAAAERTKLKSAARERERERESLSSHRRRLSLDAPRSHPITIPGSDRSSRGRRQREGEEIGHDGGQAAGQASSLGPSPKFKYKSTTRRR